MLSTLATVDVLSIGRFLFDFVDDVINSKWLVYAIRLIVHAYSLLSNWCKF